MGWRSLGGQNLGRAEFRESRDWEGMDETSVWGEQSLGWQNLERAEFGKKWMRTVFEESRVWGGKG